jgi:hypothetical protein
VGLFLFSQSLFAKLMKVIHFTSLLFLMVAGPGFGADWEGSDDFSSGVSSTRWLMDHLPDDQVIRHGNMIVTSAYGHASFRITESVTSEQQATLIWKKYPTAAESWVAEISGHNSANWSTSGGSQLQLYLFDLGPAVENAPRAAGRISMARGWYGNPPQFNVGNLASAPAPSADFRLRLVYRATAKMIETWYDPYSLGTGWTKLYEISLNDFSPEMVSTDFFGIGIFSNCYIGPITEGQVYADNFRLSALAKSSATVVMDGLSHVYDGTAKTALVTTVPAGLEVDLTYNGSTALPVNAGNYFVLGTINDPNYQGSATSTMVISKATGTVNLGGLSQIYDGTAKPVTATTMPPDLTVDLTYNGSTSLPIEAGSYTVVGIINNANYQGGATNTMIIDKPVMPPLLVMLSPSSVQPGSDVFFLYVDGSNFYSNSIIQWNSINQPTRLVSSNRLRATIEAELVASPASADITVFNPGLSGGVVSTMSLPFIIGQPPSPPQLIITYSGPTATISWNTTGFKLQSTLALPPANWQDVAGSESTNSATVMVSEGSRFFRLSN